jgi:hypothetical protein
MFRCRIEDDFPSMRVRVHLIEELGAQRRVHSKDSPLAWVGTEESTANLEPWAIVPYEALPALLSAISRHLGAVEHPQQLRRDYDEERGRVDRLIEIIANRGGI